MRYPIGGVGRRGVLAALAAACAPGAWARPRPAQRPAPHDLTGVWTSAWYTRLQRPKGFKGLIATPAEAEAYEAPRRAHAGELIDPHDELGQAMTEFPDNGPGLARIGGQPRSSWIVDPADGHVPWRPEAMAILRPGEDIVDFDNVEARDTDERCITGGSVGPPILNSHDANLVTFVLTAPPGRAGWMLIAGERNHEVRIVEVAGSGPPAAPPAPADPPRWWGVSRGVWDGATLVVTTTRQRPGLTKISDDLYLSDHARVVERFTRTGGAGAGAGVAYAFEVTDETLFTRAWRGELVFRPAEGAMFEYACHEGNYSLPGILAGGRTKGR